MHTLARTSLALILAGAPLLALTPSATAEVTDCTYTKSKKLVTLTINNSDTTGWLVIERSLGTMKIGYRSEGHSWRGCEGANTENTNKVRVVGSTLSEEIYLSLENGAFAPGATSESNGASEIEFVLDLNSGTDTVTLLGGRGSDRLGFTKPGQGFLNGDDDADLSLSGVDVWRLDGGSGNDVLDGRGAPSVMAFGREGSDRLFGGPGRDHLYGDAGDDPVGDGSDVLNGGGGDDDLLGYRGGDTLVGGDGDDSLRGHENNDDLKGGSGDDSLYSEESKDGADDFDGGAGSDRLYYYDRSGDVRIVPDGKANDGGKGEDDDVAGNIESLYGGSGNDTLVGTNAANSLNGNDGNDVLKGLGGEDSLGGGDGNDDLFGGTGDEYFNSESGNDKIAAGAGDDYVDTGGSDDGSDVLSGGEGYDTVNYSSRSVGLLIDVTAGSNDGEPGEGDAVRADFETIYGGSGSDEILGSSAAEYISGGGSTGADVINGRGGRDTLNGNDGNDQLTGGEGFDDINAGSGDDEIWAEDNGEDDVDCSSGASDTLMTHDDYDSYTGCEVVV